MKLLHKLSKKMERQFNMSVIGSNVGMPGGVIQLLGLEFQIYKKLTKDEARKILIECSREFLIEINRDENIRNNLKNYPFTDKNIEITLYIYEPSRESIYYPDIDTAAMNQGRLKFTTTDKENIHVYKTREYELFDEALKIIENSK
jgi:hypothetical protein